MFKDSPIIKIITIFIVPYIFLYALYIQLNGEVSPGGGFQAGVIFASGLLAYEIVYGIDLFKQYIPINTLIIISILGVMIYATTGIISLFTDDNYLNYYSLSKHHYAQELGIFAVEVGIGLTVSSIMCLIYIIFQTKSKDEL